MGFGAMGVGCAESGATPHPSAHAMSAQHSGSRRLPEMTWGAARKLIASPPRG